MAKMPNFAIGGLSKLQDAANRGIPSYPTCAFVSDKEYFDWVERKRVFYGICNY